MAKAEIRVRWWRDEASLHLTISDDGPGVAEQELGNLTRRGWHLDTASPGSGFGLSIVREIVDVYRIGFVLRNREAGSGLGAELLFAHT
jgi:signal transduction histidine kinase